MKYIFLNSPCFRKYSAPIIGIPTLIGLLEENGVDAKYIDYNTDFIHFITDKNNSNNFINFYNEIIKKPDNFLQEKYLIDYIQANKQYIDQQLEVVKKNADNSSFYLSVLQNESSFYNRKLSLYSQYYLEKYIETIGRINRTIFNYISGFGVKGYENHLINSKCTIDVNKLIGFFNSKLNIFKDYYDIKIKEILELKPDIIGITIAPVEQILPALYFAYRIKEKTNIHINIGGSFFHTYHSNINNLQDLFVKFFDTISINNNTKTVIQLVKNVSKDIDISEIPNILYLKNNEIIQTVDDEINFKNYPKQSFSGYKKEDYTISQMVLPIQASQGCYWGKCIFCSCSAKPFYIVKNPLDVVDEIEYLSKKYSTKYFYFWDNAVSPSFLDIFSNEVLKRKLNIRYSIYARFDSDFDSNLLKKIRKSGCIVISWGLDSASSKILEYINKGINVKTAERILKNSYKLGIMNLVYLIIGHPTEDYKDIELDYEFIKKNKKYIQELSIGEEVVFVNGSIISENVDYYSNLIKIPFLERKELKNKIQNEFNKSLSLPILHAGTNILLLADKYGNKIFV